jgi:hypothetical protein
MPTEIKGVIELRKALRAYAPDLEKETRKEIYEIVKPVVANAKGYVPSEIMGLRKGWIRSTRTLKKITRGTSAFRKGVFPFFNPAEVKAKIVFSDKISKSNRSGFVSVFKLENKSRAGAIYEIAGRANNGQAQPWVGPKGPAGHKYSHSRNPDAGQHFINAISNSGTMKGEGPRRGRLLYRAWNENQGRANAAVLKAIEKATERFNKRATVVDLKREAA